MPVRELEEWLDARQMAARFAISKRTLLRWINQPDGLPHVRVGRQILFNVKSINEWLADRETRRNPGARKARR